jgi:hypothetical protein
MVYVEFPSGGGVVSDATTRLNSNFNSLMVHHIDTSTNLNVSVTGNNSSNVTATANKDYVFTSSEVAKMGDYLIIDISGKFSCIAEPYAAGSVNVSSIGLTIQNTTTSTTIINDSSFLYSSSNSSTTGSAYNTINTPKFFYPITSGDRANGMTINIKVDVANNGASTVSTSFTNRAIVFSSQNLVT